MKVEIYLTGETFDPPYSSEDTRYHELATAWENQNLTLEVKIVRTPTVSDIVGTSNDALVAAFCVTDTYDEEQTIVDVATAAMMDNFNATGKEQYKAVWQADEEVPISEEDYFYGNFQDDKTISDYILKYQNINDASDILSASDYYKIPNIYNRDKYKLEEGKYIPEQPPENTHLFTVETYGEWIHVSVLWDTIEIRIDENKTGVERAGYVKVIYTQNDEVYYFLSIIQPSETYSIQITRDCDEITELLLFSRPSEVETQTLSVDVDGGSKKWEITQVEKLTTKTIVIQETKTVTHGDNVVESLETEYFHILQKHALQEGEYGFNVEQEEVAEQETVNLQIYNYGNVECDENGNMIYAPDSEKADGVEYNIIVTHKDDPNVFAELKIKYKKPEETSSSQIGRMEEPIQTSVVEINTEKTNIPSQHAPVQTIEPQVILPFENNINVSYVSHIKVISVETVPEDSEVYFSYTGTFILGYEIKAHNIVIRLAENLSSFSRSCMCRVTNAEYVDASQSFTITQVGYGSEIE